jgi:hypothetical protein
MDILDKHLSFVKDQSAFHEKIKNPIVFQALGSSAAVATITHGYDATILIDVCNAIIQAERAITIRAYMRIFAI